MIAPRDWKRAFVGFGLVTVAAYLAVALRLLPMPALRVLFISVGPFMAIAIYAMGQWLALERDSVALRLAILLHVVAAAFVSAMALIQNVNIAFMRPRILAAPDDARREVLKAVFHGVDGVQLGLDLAWDLWLTVGAIFLAVALLRHPGFGRVIGWSGIAAATVVLALNLWTFPVPPDQAGWVDAGPVLALWYLAVIILAVRRRGTPPLAAAEASAS